MSDRPDDSTVVTVLEDGSTLVSTVEFEDGLRRVQNLATWVALGGTVPDTQSIWD